jgi:hypothetical protein
VPQIYYYNKFKICREFIIMIMLMLGMAAVTLELCGGPQVSHANKKITTQTKVTARKQKLTARKQKLTAPKKKLMAPKKKLTAPKKKLTAPKKCSRHQRKTHGTK